MRMLVVDDEYEIREYLADMPEWEQARCKVVGKAANGMEALALMETVMPDAVLTDIRMPIMDGFALAEAVKRNYPDVPVIFLTAHHEFEYARQAISLGAADFITKPFQPEDIVRVVGNLRAKGRDSWREQESFFAALGDEARSTEEKLGWLKEQGIEDGSFILLYAELDQAHSSTFGRNPFALKRLRNLLEIMFRRKGQAVRMSDTSAGVFALVPLEGEAVGEAEVRADGIKLAKRMMEVCESEEELSISVSVSRKMTTCAHLPEAIRQMRACMDYRMLLGPNSLLTFDGIEKIIGEKEKESFSAFNRLTDLLRTGQTEDIREGISAAYRSLLETVPSRKDIQHLCIGIIERSEDTLLEFGIEPDAQAAVEVRETMLASLILTDMMRALERYVLGNADAVQRLMEQSPKRLVAETKRIIEAEYAADLSLQAVAKRINVNYSYLSRLIKKETGKNFTELLWECRIEAAKAKLLGEDLKAYEVAYAVGFKDYAHFSLLFKKMTGYAPSNFKIKSNSKTQQ